MSGVEIIQAGIGAGLGLILWGLKTALTDLRDEIKDIRNVLFTDTVRKADLSEVKSDIASLFGKCNALAVECARKHGGE